MLSIVIEKKSKNNSKSNRIKLLNAERNAACKNFCLAANAYKEKFAMMVKKTPKEVILIRKLKVLS